MLSLTDSVYCLDGTLGRFLQGLGATHRLQHFVSIFCCDDEARQRKEQVHSRNMPQIVQRKVTFSAALPGKYSGIAELKVFLSVTFVCPFVLIDPCSFLHSAAVRALVLAPPAIPSKLPNLKCTCACPRRFISTSFLLLSPNLKSRNPPTLVVRHNPLSFTINHNRSLPTHLPNLLPAKHSKAQIPHSLKHIGRMKSFAAFALFAASIASAQVT